jgi:hypothetical protein
MRKFALTATVLAIAAMHTAQARVTQLVVEDRVTVADGKPWGSAGAYERLKGTAYMEVDPRDPLNAIIVNLDKAPRNARGMVEYSTQFLILKPVDVKRGNHKIWYGMNNRGNCIECPGARIRSRRRRAARSPPPTSATTCSSRMATSSWTPAGMATAFRRRTSSSRRSRSRTSRRFVHPRPAAPGVPGRRQHVHAGTGAGVARLPRGRYQYHACDAHRAQSHGRAAPGDPARALGLRPVRDGPGEPGADATDLCLFDGFQAGRIYELIYTAKDPIVMGLAYAVTRDLGSFLKYETADDLGNPNPIAVSDTKTGIKFAYSSGTSSTGMYQRDFLYNGFNEDESHRKVFDGATIYSAATHKLFANVQFAHPTFYSGQDQHHDFTSNSIRRSRSRSRAIRSAASRTAS